MLRIGLIGFSGSGKTTLFQLLTGATPDPAAVTRSGQVGVVELPDDRLMGLQRAFEAARVVPPTLELLDTPGIDPSGTHAAAHTLGVLRAVDGLVYVVNRRGEPVGRAAFDRLFALVCDADRAVLEGRLERIDATLKKPRPASERQELIREKEDVQRMVERLRNGEAVEASDAVLAVRRGYPLLSAKPFCVVVNVDDDSELDMADQQAEREFAGIGTLVLNAGLEAELRELEPEERALFVESYNLGSGGLRSETLPRRLAEALGLITFYTGNRKEVRAWLVPRCTTARRAAGLIHSDMERGFISAEVTRADRLVEIGSEREAHRQGAYHSEGKDYHVCDGDVLLIRFSV